MEIDGSESEAFKRYRTRTRSSESSEGSQSTINLSFGDAKDELDESDLNSGKKGGASKEPPTETEDPEDPNPDESDDSGASDQESEPEDPMPNEIELKLSRLLDFHGSKDKDTVTAKAWAESVDYAQKVVNLNDEKTAAYAAAALRGDAAVWLQSLRERKSEALNSWNAMRKIFLEWFHEKRTVAQRQELQRSLKQKSGETVRAFYNRVDIACFTMEEDWPTAPATLSQDGKAGFEQAKKALHDVMFKDYFLAGLHKDVRDLVLTSNPESLQDAFKKAVDIESSIREKNPAKMVNEIQLTTTAGASGGQAQEEKLDTIVAAVVKKLNQNQNQNQTQSKKKDASGKETRKETRECFYCGIAGHIEPQCFKKKDDFEKDLYRPVNPRSRPFKKKEAAAVTVEAIQKQPSAAAPAQNARPMVPQPQHQGNRFDMYGAIETGNAYWDP